MPHRPDPVDLNPLKFILFGETVDGKPFTTGFWTRDFSFASPPVFSDGSAFAAALKPCIAPQVNFLGYGWRLKTGTIYSTFSFGAPVAGTNNDSDAVTSSSATLSYGGISIDQTGAVRNIRCISHVPRGYIRASETGVLALLRSVSYVNGFLNWLGTQHPTDNFGHPLTLYSTMDLQNNAHYQNRSGF